MATESSQATSQHGQPSKPRMKSNSSPSRHVKGIAARQKFAEQLESLEANEGVRDLGTLAGERDGQIRLYSVVKVGNSVLYVDRDEHFSPNAVRSFAAGEEALGFWGTLAGPVYQASRTEQVIQPRGTAKETLQGPLAEQRFVERLKRLQGTEGVRDLGSLTGERDGQIRLYSVVKVDNHVIYVDQDAFLAADTPEGVHSFSLSNPLLVKTFWKTLDAPVYQPAETTQ